MCSFQYSSMYRTKSSDTEQSKTKLLHLSSSVKCLPCSCGCGRKCSQFEERFSFIYPVSGKHQCHVSKILKLSFDLFRFKGVQVKTCLKVEHVPPKIITTKQQQQQICKLFYSVEEIYQTPETRFYHIPEHRKKVENRTCSTVEYF